MTQRINVAFAVNDTYVPYLEIALFSLLKNNLSNQFDICILSSDISKKSLKKLNKIARHFNNATIQVAKLGDERLKEFKAELHFSHDIYSRYLLPDILTDKERVLYLDADILVTGNISKLYYDDFENNYIIGIRDIGIGKPMFEQYLQSLNLHGKGYINSGVLVMNLDKIRQDDKVEELITTTIRLSDKIRHPDQDVINIVFSDNIKYVDCSWNFQDEDRKDRIIELEEAKIIHYTTEKKPWNTPNVLREYNAPAQELYELYEQEYLTLFDYLEKVSIIVPVYNTDKKYLEACIESIQKQTYGNLEILIIDDGSKPETAQQLDKIASADQRIKILHIKNGGTNNARKIGFEASSGAYIAFVDSDDTIEPNMVHKLFRACRNDSADIAMSEYWDDIMAPTATPGMYEPRLVDGKGNIIQAMYKGFPVFRTIPVVVWSKLYARKVLAAIDWEFSSYSMSEDEFMAVQLFSNASRVTLVRDQLYYYRLQVSTSKEFNYPHFNTFNGKKIPMLQTPRNLYEKSKEYYESKKIKYDKDELLIHYVYFIGRCAYKLAMSGGIDKENQQELAKQRDMYMQKILNRDGLLGEFKIRAVVAYDSPIHIGIIDDVDKKQRERVHSLNGELNWLRGELNLLRGEFNSLQAQKDALLEEHAQFFGVKRSAKLFAGNVKRKLRIRTRIRIALRKP